MIIMTIILKQWELEKRAKFEEFYQQNIELKLKELKTNLLTQGFTEKENNSFRYDAINYSFFVIVQLEIKKGKSLLYWDYLDEDAEEECWISDIEHEDELQIIISTNEILKEAILKVKQLILMQVE